MRDITIAMGTKHGVPAALLAALSERGVEVVAGCLFPRIEGRVAHITVSDDQVDLATEVVVDQGAAVLDVREVIVVPRQDRPSFAEMAKAISDAGASVYIAYFGAEGEVVLGTSDLALAKEALGLS